MPALLIGARFVKGAAAAFTAPGLSSFSEFLGAAAPELLPGRRPLPPGISADIAPHATTIVAISCVDGVVMAGDRRATMGNLIASRDIEKVHAADEFSLVGIAGCDKSEPAMLMAMARLNLPAVYLYGGTILPGSASDAMLPLDTATSQPPLAPRVAKPKARDAASEGDAAAGDAAPAEAAPAAAAPAPAAAPEG